jgi:hypothetical protein
VLYLTIFFGLYAQIVLGGIQILTALSIFFIWNRLKKEHKKQILFYWLLVILYGIGWLRETNLNDFWWLGFILIPMSIATYFVWLLNNIKNIDYENSNS